MTADAARRIAALAEERRQGDARLLIAIAGAPASGKSTLARVLEERYRTGGGMAQVVPMDGFHLDNRVLGPAGLLARKGAPETFDREGFARIVKALREGGTVYAPVFDRDRDIAIAGATEISAQCRTVIFEGNYLLFDAPGWRDLAAFWDVAIRLDVDMATLHRRLVERWLSQGMDADAAQARAQGNDLANAARVAAAALPADLVIEAG